ncbi:MAG TPA: mechanosensitive ion channel [Armatimonadota bacterium]|nr:mechanosensitive ion channel [Armatimonadota bacterium]
MPGGFVGWVSALLTSLAAAVGAIIAFIPLLLAAVIILLIGWGIGKLAQTVVVNGLQALHFNRLMDREGITDALRRAEVKTTPAQILGVIAYWFVFLVAVYAAVSVMGITALTALMTAVVLYLPRIFGALLVVLLGAWAATMLARLTRTSATAAGISFAQILGNVVLGTVLFFAFAMALSVLGLDFPFLLTAFAILLGGLVLALTLAFGLGGREYAADMLAGRQLKMVLHEGDRLVTDNLDGTVASIGPTMTVIQTSGGEVAVQNAALMHHRLLHKKRGGEGGGSVPFAA